jgi:hypothetical protein
MKRIFSFNDMISAIQRGDAYIRKGDINNLYNAEIEYNKRIWKVTDVGITTITLED